jgi:hypothetical protein
MKRTQNRMRKEEFAGLVRKIRSMLASGADAECPCPKIKCEWHGDCYRCVRIHRHYGDHVPNCLQPILRGKIEDLARAAELKVQAKPMTPDGHWEYVRRSSAPGMGMKHKSSLHHKIKKPGFKGRAARKS